VAPRRRERRKGKEGVERGGEYAFGSVEIQILASPRVSNIKRSESNRSKLTAAEIHII
jgi:hypothetical protein